MRHTCEVVLSKSVNILQMRFTLALIRTDAFVVKVHKHAVLVPKFIHNVMVLISAFVHKDRLESCLRFLFKYLDYVLRLGFLGTSWFDRVLSGSEEFVTVT